jgi:hypothetical protein
MRALTISSERSLLTTLTSPTRKPSSATRISRPRHELANSAANSPQTGNKPASGSPSGFSMPWDPSSTDTDLTRLVDSDLIIA